MINRLVAGVLCLLLSPLPALCAPQANGQHAGQITALVPAASLNTRPASVKDDLNWNDLLKTEHSGRIRAGLADGSILSVGSDSELKVVQHDAASQQTSLELNFGKVRSEVVKVTKPSGKFEIKTPNAVIGVIGTKFYVAYGNNKTTVICYTGVVTVTPLAGALAMGAAQAGTASSVNLSAGQMVEVSNEVPPGGIQSSSTPSELQQATIGDTNIAAVAPAAVATHTALTTILIGTGMAVGVTTGIVLGSRDNGNGPPKVLTCQQDPKQPKCQ